jgi:hypothetical protein
VSHDYFHIKRALRIVKKSKWPYNINLMPEMEPHETFDGKPATFEVPDFLPAFEVQKIKVGVYDPSLFDALEEEAKARNTDRRTFVACCNLLGAALYELYDDTTMVLRDGLGFKKPIDYMAPEYYLSEEAKKMNAATHVLNMGGEATNLLMRISNKHRISTDEAFERNMRIGLEVSRAQRATGVRTYTETPLGTMEEQAFFFKVDQEQS